MINFFSNHKIIFYLTNFSLIFLYLFPGSLIGLIIYSDKKIQPQITSDFIISSNHFYVFILLSIISFLSFNKLGQSKIVAIYLIVLMGLFFIQFLIHYSIDAHLFFSRWAIYETLTVAAISFLSGILAGMNFTFFMKYTMSDSVNLPKPD